MLSSQTQHIEAATGCTHRKQRTCVKLFASVFALRVTCALRLAENNAFYNTGLAMNAALVHKSRLNHASMSKQLQAMRKHLYVQHITQITSLTPIEAELTVLLKMRVRPITAMLSDVSVPYVFLKSEFRKFNIGSSLTGSRQEQKEERAHAHSRCRRKRNR